MWTPQPRGAEAQALYDAAEADHAARPERYALDVDAITAAAFRKEPLGAEDDGDWREGLAIYLAAARDEGRLNALGVKSTAATAIGRLQARAAIARALERDPAIRARTIDRPIFVIGGWRTGTTLLQRLLAAAPDLRAAYPSELAAPWRFALLDSDARQSLIDAGAAAHDLLHLLNPAMQAIHPSGARLAEECVLAMGTDFRNWGFTSTLRCPRYAAWLARQDLSGSYRRYADILRLLDDGSGRRWILKAPAHTAELPALLAAFPDAIVVHLHRDVVQTVTSGASLFAVFRSTYSDHVDAAEVGRYQLDTTATWFERALRARDVHPGARVIDVSFTELVADPIAIARAICRVADVAWSDATETSLRVRLGELQEQHGAHRYTPQDFGLDPDEIRARFADYRSRFGLP
jgi:LPS sulfotransferase NodH